MRRKANRRVVALVYDGLCTFEFAIAVEVFGLPRPELNIEDWYRFSATSIETGPARATGGIRIVAQKGLGALNGAGTIVIPGWRDPDAIPPQSLLRAVRRAHERGVRLMSICSGVWGSLSTIRSWIWPRLCNAATVRSGRKRVAGM